MNLTCPVLILTVDDEPDLCVLTKEFLETSGYIKVDTAGSVFEARAAIAQKHYDVIVSDYQMPGEDGIQFLRSLRASGDMTPFILFTGKGREEVVIEAFENGADAYLQKGGEPRSLFVEMEHRVGAIIQRHQAEAARLESESDFRTLFENSPDPIVLVSPDGKILNTNQAGARMMLMSKDEIIGGSISDLGVFSENDVALFQRTMMAMVKGESVSPVVSQVHRKDGTKRWVELSASVVMKSGRFHAIQIIARDITCIKQVGEALREANSQLRVAMDLAHLVYWEYDENSDMYTFNDRFYDLNGTNVEREGGYSISREAYYRDFIHPDDVDFVLGMVAKAPNYLRDNLHFTHRIIRGDGEVRFIEVYPCQMRDDKGNVVKVFGVNQDITEQKRVETALRESEGRYRSLYMDNRDAIMILSPERGFIAGNPATCRLFACKDDQDFISHTPEQLSPKHQPGGALSTVKARENMRLALENGTQYFEWTHRRADGTDFPATVLLSRLENGIEPLIQATVRDITDSKRADQELKESVGLNRAILENAGVGLTYFNIEGRLIRINSIAAGRLSGRPEDLIGRDIKEMYGLKRGSVYLELMKKAIISGKPNEHEELFSTEQGARCLISVVSYVPSTINDSGFLTLTHDITDRKAMEEALHIANRKLNLLSSITRHDISNQIYSLDGHLSLLEMRQPFLVSDEHLIKARIAAKRISEMIQFSKEYEDIGVQAPIWQDVRKLVELSAKGVPSRGEVSIMNDVPIGTKVFADPLILKVFQNLIQNACHHGHNVTSIRFSVEEKAGIQTILCEDDGAGIPREMKGNLFSKGFGKDHGLGLFLSREILSITGITITEESELGMGARFVITPPQAGIMIA